jgi:hypothetical protein
MKTAKKTTPHGYRIVCVILGSFVEIGGLNATRVFSDNEATEPLWSPNVFDLETVPWMHDYSTTR